MIHAIALMQAWTLQAIPDANEIVQPRLSTSQALVEVADSATQNADPVLNSEGFLGNSLWQWLALLGILLASFVVGKTVAFFLERHGAKLRDSNRLRVVGRIFGFVAGPTKMFCLAIGLYVAGLVLTLDAKLELLWFKTCAAVAVIAAAWVVFRMVDIAEDVLQRLTSKTETQLDDQLVPLIRKTLRVFVVIVTGLLIAQGIYKWDIGPLVAGLGIGGLAFALAAKDTIANLFGSVTIFTDRPFQLGDRIKIKGHDGTVEEVGFRSTRIRTLVGHLVTLPNAVITNEPIENVSKRSSLKRVLNVTVTYDTSPEKVQRAVDILREMLAARMEHFHPDKPPRVYFSDFNADSLNIVVYYWYAPAEWWNYMEFSDAFNFELLTRYNDEGIEFAFPTQTLYVKQDSPLTVGVRPNSKG